MPREASHYYKHHREVKWSSTERKHLITFLDKHLWNTQCQFTQNPYLLLVVYRLWLFLLTVRCSLRTVLIPMKPEVRCTSVASIVSLFIDIEKKMWPISHFRDWADWWSIRLLTLTTLHPLKLLNETSHVTRGGPTLTTDRTQSLLVGIHSCNKAQAHPWHLWVSIVVWRIDAYKHLSHTIS